MYAVARLISRGVYTVSGPFHPFGGAVDIIVVQQPDGSFKSSPWYVRFGKFQGVLKTKEKVVNINVNGVEANFHMYLDHKGEAYFLSDVVGEEEEEEEEEEEGDLILSPPSSGEETDEQLQSETSIESKSCNFDANQKNSSDQNDKGDDKIVTRTNSRRSKILGLVFGGKSMKKENGSGEGNVERWDSLQRAEIAADLLEVKWSTNLPTDEVTNPNFNCLRTKEQDLMEISDVAEAQKETSAGLQNPGDETKMDSISGSVVDLQNPHLAELEVKASSQSVIEQASNDSNGLLGDGVYEEEIRKERVSSYIYCETSESSPVGVENSGEEATETPSLSNGGSEKAQVHDGVHYEAIELISEVSSQPEAGALIVKENIHDIGLLSGEDSCMIPKTESMSGKIGSSIDSIAESIKIELDSLVDLQMVTSDSIEAENLQIIQLKTITERLNDGNKLELKPVEVFENQSMTKFSNSIHQDQEVESFVEENKMNNHYSSLESIVYTRGADVDYLPMEVTNSSIPLPESSEEEDQFLFSDIDHLTSSTVQCKELISPDFTGTEDHHLSSLDDIQNEHDSNEINHDSPSSSDNLVQDCSPVTCQDLLEESRTTSSPLSIPSGRKGPLEVGRMMESLPNFRSHIDNLEISDVLPPLSCSLDSSSRRLRWELLRREGSIPCKSNPDSDNGFLKEQDKISDACNLEGLKRMSLEISLCKHLLSKGMGVDAASQAFDAEKVDLEKFASLASAPLKNDRLVVRIGGRYFPWDAAVPIISGMTSFGHEQNFEPEGMIAVDRVEETLEGHSPRAIIASGGSWRWPFSFKRSGTMGSVHPGLDSIRGSDAYNASELSSYLSPNKNVQKIKVTEKKVKSIVPTSEQMASLNLKEGQNVITFTFSTAMLGKQQVDARIYLLKWNTRIVISDVDGTITKSDVLGQFMPLVGKDWSQTGVAHLFSAIEENGYKFLYLSARSVSQAYLTRQFLINLKQDGKALPDGPVVISPDGLFPSLFREVIRRAPHEFKIACLEDIKALFPPDCNPFYAGFGNRNTDEISYLRVGIPKGKIFTINPKGEVAVNRRVDTKSYTSLHALVNGMFPAMSSAGQEEFNSWNFWKVPLPHLDI